jgi:hypothetical protein
VLIAADVAAALEPGQQRLVVLVDAGGEVVAGLVEGAGAAGGGPPDRGLARGQQRRAQALAARRRVDGDQPDAIAAGAGDAEQDAAQPGAERDRGAARRAAEQLLLGDVVGAIVAAGGGEHRPSRRQIGRRQLVDRRRHPRTVSSVAAGARTNPTWPRAPYTRGRCRRTQLSHYRIVGPARPRRDGRGLSRGRSAPRSRGRAQDAAARGRGRRRRRPGPAPARGPGGERAQPPRHRHAPRHRHRRRSVVPGDGAGRRRAVPVDLGPARPHRGARALAIVADAAEALAAAHAPRHPPPRRQVRQPDGPDRAARSRSSTSAWPSCARTWRRRSARRSRSPSRRWPTSAWPRPWSRRR